MRVKRDGESTAIASSPQQVLHATEKHIIVDHERSQVHLVSSTPSTQVPVLSSYHILNSPGLLGNDPRSIFSAHLLASLQQLATATNTDGRYQIPLTIQLPSQLYTPTSTIQVSAQPPTSTIQIPQQILMNHHDLNVLTNVTDTNLNLLQGSQQPPPQSQYETIISRLMRGFIDNDTALDGISSHQLSTSSGSTVTTTTNSMARHKDTKPARKYNRAKNNNDKVNDSNSNNKTKSNKRDVTHMIDSTTANSLITAAKNKKNKSNAVNGTGGNGPIIIPNLAPNYNRQIFHDRGVHPITADFLTTPVNGDHKNPALTAIPENEKATKKRKNANATSTPKKKDKLITIDAVDQIQPVSSSSPTQLLANNNNSRDKVFTCPICKRTFGYKHVLQNHERTHTGEKPFECNICSKKFTRDHHLKTRMRLHTGEKPYQCSHCDRQFVQVANLRRHLRVHTGERPYACEICASKFSDSNQLKAHNLIHKGEKPYNCLECGGKFRRRHHLIHHKCNNNNSGTPSQAKIVEAMTPVLGKGETICTYMVPPALSPPLSSSPVAPARSIHSGGSSNSSLSSNGGTRTNGSTKRERKSRETRRIIRPEGLPQSTSGMSPISLVGRKIIQGDTIMANLQLSEEQTQPQDLSFANSNSITDKFKKLQPASVIIPQQQGSILPRHYTGSHSSCSGTSLSSPSPPTSGSHQEDSIFAHCNSEEEPPEFTSASSHNGSSSRSSNCSGDEEHHLSHITPPTSCSSNGGGDHPNLDKGNVELGEEKMDWRFTQFHNSRDKFKGDA